jgi:hypothetical protein
MLSELYLIGSPTSDGPVAGKLVMKLHTDLVTGQVAPKKAVQVGAAARKLGGFAAKRGAHARRWWGGGGEKGGPLGRWRC